MLITAPRALCQWWTDKPDFGILQLCHHAMLITDDAKEFRWHILYLSQIHLLVYREETIQAFLWSKFLILCLGAFSFIVLRYREWRMATNLRSTENSYYQMQWISTHLCLLSFLPKYQTPSYGILFTWYCKSSLTSRKHWIFPNCAWL